jgi:predicted ATP-grasp superfamily ATP-dependent carboligase
VLGIVSSKTPATEPIDVLVTDGNTRASLAVVRSLARRGIRFLVLGPDAESPAFYSRSVGNVLVSPSPAKQPEAFIEFVLEVIRKYEIKLAIPVTDQALVLFDQHRAQLEKHTRLAMASATALRGALDKRRSLEVARELGVPCPDEFVLKDNSQIPELIARLGFPVVLKRPGDPLDGSVPAFDFRVLYANDEKELRQMIERHCRPGHYPIFQERASGEVHNLCCFAAAGDVVAVHEYQSIRRLDGAGVLRRIVEPIPELEGYTRALLQALRWDGVAHVAFFVDRERRKVWFMEINGRFWASTEGSVHAGWDFPAWTCDYFLHGKVPTPAPLQVGSMTCWHTGDVQALFNYLRGGETPTTGTTPSHATAILECMSDFRPGIHSDVFRWSDPMPALAELWRMRDQVRGFMRKRMGRAGAARALAASAHSG